ncbi:MAG TPA: methylglyoxal synthase [Bacilli bacterium]|nr:methylglyoxal synthase [Bacilli bacterium]
MKKLTIAIIAHDHKKDEMIAWCRKNLPSLQKHNLVGTGTTARLVSEATGLTVQAFLSGPLGGDQQIGAAIATGQIDLVIFLADPLTAQPHDPDVKALLRIAAVYNIPMANNIATADLIIKSALLG